MNLLARKRGIFWIVYLFFKGISRGEPIYIGIAIALVLGIIGYVMYQARAKSNASDVADYAQEFQQENNDPNQTQ